MMSLFTIFESTVKIGVKRIQDAQNFSLQSVRRQWFYFGFASYGMLKVLAIVFVCLLSFFFVFVRWVLYGTILLR